MTKINSLLANFLWSTCSRKGIAKVAWCTVNKPTRFGGLGLRDIGMLNKAFLMRHIWDTVNDKNSLWVE